MKLENVRWFLPVLLAFHHDDDQQDDAGCCGKSKVSLNREEDAHSFSGDHSGDQSIVLLTSLDGALSPALLYAVTVK